MEYEEFEVGDIIVNIDPRVECGMNSGKIGKIVQIDYEGYVHVQYSDGSTGKSNKPEKYYRHAFSSERERYYQKLTPSNNKEVINTPMSTIKTFFKNITLSKSEKLLRKYGLKTECGEYTSTAIDIVIAKLCADNEAHLIEIAEGFEAEIKEDK